MGVLLVVVLALAGISAALSLLLHPGPLTYYGTHTRAYQLLAGAALAIAARRWIARPPGAAAGSARLAAAAALLSAAALAALVLLANRIHEARDYPGLAGIAVTCASVALIAALDLMGDHPLRRVAGAGLPAAIGRLSYSLYLWHWPTIVFLPLVARRHGLPSLASTPALIAAMTVLALSSYRLWEQPLRFGVLSRRVVVAGLAASAALAALSIAVLQPPSGFESRALASVKDMATPGTCPYFGRDWPAPADSRACVRRRGSGLTIALVGDSHAHQWQPALDLLAARHDLTVIRATRGGCPANDVTVDRADDLGLNGSGAECTAWRHRVYADLVARYDPDVVFVATRGHVSAVLDGARRIAPFTPAHRRRWSAAWDWTLRTLGAGGASVVVSRILPTLPQRVPACLASAGRPSRACDFPVGVDRRVGAYNAIVDRLVRRGPRIAIFDPTPIGCPGGTCRAMSGDVVVHRDDNHLSATFVRARAAQFATRLARSLATLGRRAPAGAHALSMR
jgi:hypothetical protein